MGFLGHLIALNYHYTEYGIYAPQGPLQNILLAGSVDGSLVAYDTAKMAVVWRKSGSEGAITAMTVIANSNSMIAMTSSRQAMVLDMGSGNCLARWVSPSKLDATNVLSLSDGRLILAGTTISLVDSTTGARLGKWAGHATPIVDMAIAGEYFCSAASGDRTIAIWSTKTAPSGRLEKRNAVGQATLNQPIAQLSLAHVSPGCFHAAVVTLSGDLHLFKCTLDHNRQVESVETREWAVSDTGGLPVAQVSINSADEDGVEMTVVFGTVVKPRFSTMTLKIPEQGTILDIPKPDSYSDELLMKSVVNQSGFGSSKTSVAMSVAGEHEDVHLLGIMNAPINNHDIDSPSDDDILKDHSERNLTFAEKIAALKDNNMKGSAPATWQQDGTKASTRAPKADSLATLLSQAISNEDKALLEKCLSVKNPKTILKTSRMLTPVDATKLIKILIQRLHASPRRATELSTWIKSILIHHAGYFSGMGTCKESLSNLHQIIDSRLSTYQSLLSLSGRLDLVLSSVDSSGKYGEMSENNPLISVNIDSDGTLEVQDAAAAAGFEDEDEDDEEGYTSDENMMSEDSDIE